jgi:UDP-N-acetylmuramyl tripeptide synthase
MGAIAAEGADVIVVTSDNPRSEDPAVIVEAVLAGVPTRDAHRVFVEPDRADAIALAFGRATVADVVVIAGKGHETYQEIAGERRPFDDRAVVRALVEREQA